jgi:hypothetical protein
VAGGRLSHLFFPRLRPGTLTVKHSNSYSVTVKTICPSIVSLSINSYFAFTTERSQQDCWFSMHCDQQALEILKSDHGVDPKAVVLKSDRCHPQFWSKVISDKL